jgi:hypothetical protein
MYTGYALDNVFLLLLGVIHHEIDSESALLSDVHFITVTIVPLSQCSNLMQLCAFCRISMISYNVIAEGVQVANLIE